VSSVTHTTQDHCSVHEPSTIRTTELRNRAAPSKPRRIALCRGNASLCRSGAYVATRAAGRNPMRGLARPSAEVVKACLAHHVGIWGFWFGFALRCVALLGGVFVQLHLALFPAGEPFLPSLSLTHSQPRHDVEPTRNHFPLPQHRPARGFLSAFSTKRLSSRLSESVVIPASRVSTCIRWLTQAAEGHQCEWYKRERALACVTWVAPQCTKARVQRVYATPKIERRKQL
jgi:hypothetical protein